MIVVDTSALIDLLLGRASGPELRARLAAEHDFHAPHTVDAEVLQALRGLLRGGKLTANEANDVRTDFRDLRITRYPIAPLADRAWALRDNLTAYDAAFVALAELLRVPLVTCDRKIAGAPGLRVAVELF